MSSYLLAAWAWVSSHPSYFVIGWPIVTAGISLVYKKLDSYPRVHAFLGAMVAAGFDLPTVLALLRRVLQGGPPKSTAGGGTATPPVDPPPPTAVARQALAALVLGIAVAYMIVYTPSSGFAPTVGCTKQQEIQAVQNFTPAGACFIRLVAAGVVDPLVYLGTCGGATIESILAEIESLLSPGDGGVSTALTAPTPLEKTLLQLRANTLALRAKDGGAE
jgi:hypothetical protein